MKVDRERIEKYAFEKGIKFIILFGSQAVGDRHENSDFDVAVLTTREKNLSVLKNYSEILDFLSNILGIPDYRIDLTNLNKANPFLKYEVVSSGKLLYGDEDEYADYRAGAFKDYIDSQPLFHLEKYLIKKRQNLLGELLVHQK
jgi:predicted nucleotidyltransferase